MGFMQKAENLKYVGVRYGMLSYKTDANDTHPNVVKRSVTDDNGMLQELIIMLSLPDLKAM